ncbi:hypothetical protein CAEBREN_28147 [Caenorhabditis brenneri]|uniref:Reverse transcriptase domain-containing protein n=1 Tax=Caenorhabditis brenneri TaxID=135651 RepID=G0NW77_CAEBE|nr:hypothetical protein CAEBREN_28147 [Caenorhabditis brenneri]
MNTGVITPIEHAEWAAPVVAVSKKNGTTRLCADFSTGLNDSIENNNHPLPTADEIFTKPNGGLYFSQIDLADAYLQCEVDEQAKQLLVINTHRRLFCYNRLPSGIKSALGIFQSFMDRLINGLDGTSAYLDDLIVTGSSIEEHNRRVHAVMQKLQEFGFRIRMEKCSFLQHEIKYTWTHECQKSFDRIKKILQSDLLLTHFDPNLPIIVAADASQYGVGAVISHRFPDGSEKAIYHISKALSTTQQNYSQIEKEAFGLITAVTKFHQFIHGRHFTLRTNHKPLLAIFGGKKGVPGHSANRLQRWAIIMLNYSFDIEYINTKDFGQADALSRLISERAAAQEPEDHIIAQVEVDMTDSVTYSLEHLPVTAATVRKHTKQDTVLREIMQCLKTGVWPRFEKNTEKWIMAHRKG